MEVLPKEEQARLIELAAQGDLAAQNLLVESNLGLAYYKAFQIWSASSRKVKEACDLEDLKQEALLALIIASRHVQPNAGTFTRYACVCIERRVFLKLSGVRLDVISVDVDTLQDIPTETPPAHDDPLAPIAQDALALLPEMDRDILSRWFGIGQESEQSARVIGSGYGLPRHRVHTICHKGLKQIRQSRKVCRKAAGALYGDEHVVRL